MANLLVAPSPTSSLPKSSQLNVPSPIETPDNVSYRSDDDDLLYDTPKIKLSFLHALLALVLCLPIGGLAMKNVYQMSTHLRDGRKSRARRHSRFASSLSNAAVVIGILFWCIAIIVIIIHTVVLKKDNEL